MPHQKANSVGSTDWFAMTPKRTRSEKPTSRLHWLAMTPGGRIPRFFSGLLVNAMKKYWIVCVIIAKKKTA
ncbi:MAG: hypothetical protein BGN88_02390 [Clostridiales bacterium 43-6]|nr:MAG: hypothetical protein BGN88_02390 [Clostridiales bacterium 43-6]